MTMTVRYFGSLKRLKRFSRWFFLQNPIWKFDCFLDKECCGKIEKFINIYLLHNNKSTETNKI